jgi:D-xylose transport system substrate-binding protein
MLKNVLFGLVAVLLFVVALTFYLSRHSDSSPNTTPSAAQSEKLIRIGLSLDTLKELRWQKDRDLMQERAKELGATLDVLVADEDDIRQVMQIENFISQKVDVIVIVAHNSVALVPAIRKAHQAGIPVIAYDRMIIGSDVDAYISFDSEKVGKYAAQYVMNAVPETASPVNVAYVGGAETDNNALLVKKGAMSVLDPLVAQGRVKVVFDQATTDWKPDVAYTNLKTFLDAGGKVDAVVAANDGTAFGVIRALKEHGLAGKVPVSGQDAELPAIKRLVDGTQTVTSYKPIRSLASQAIDTAVAMAKGETFPLNASVSSGAKDIPSFLIDPIPVTKENIKETVVKDGYHSLSDIY